jgi:hypothetical protein
VKAWARAEDDPVVGCYGLKTGLEHAPRNNHMPAAG